MSWHSDPEALLAYAEDRADRAVAWSVETHLTGCADCRAVLARELAPSDADLLVGARASLELPPAVGSRARAWPAVLAGVLGPPWVWPVLVAVVVGLLALAGRLPLAPAPGFAQLSWPLAVAPVLPVAMVAAVYELADRDPAVRTTVRGGLELVLLRTAAALGLAVPAVLVGLWSARADLLTWVLPGLALCVGALALGSWAGVERAALGLTAAWVVVVLLAMTPQTTLASLLRPVLAPVGPSAVGWAVLLVLAVVVLAGRRDRFDSVGSPA